MSEIEATNKAAVARFHDRLWAHGDLTAIDELFAPDAVVHMTGFDTEAATAIREDAVRYRGAFSDISTSAHSLIADGDRVVLHWSTLGTHTGTYGAVAATGKQITMTGIDIFRMADGMVVECWSIWDGLDVFDQMGVLPNFW